MPRQNGTAISRRICSKSLPRQFAAQTHFSHKGGNMANPMSKMARREAFEGYLFILPWALGYLMFRLGPLLASLYLSLTNYNGSDLPKFVGLENYKYLLTQDPRLIDSIRATLQFVGGFLPLSLILGLSI